MKARLARGLVRLVVFGLLLIPVASAVAQAEAKAPLLVMSIASADAILGDVVYLMEAAGLGDTGRLVSLMAGMYTVSLDKDKPLGALARLENDQPSALVFLPVKDLKLLLAALKPQLGEAKELDSGLLEIAGSGSQRVYIRQHGGWAFFSNSQTDLASVPQDPLALLGGLNQNYTIAARLNVQSVPTNIRELAVANLRKGFAEGMNRNLDERQRAVAEKLGESWLKKLVSLIEDAECVTLGIKADAKTKKTYLGLDVSAVAGSELSKQMALNQPGPSAFGGFLSADGGVDLHVNAKTGADEIESVTAVLALAREEALRNLAKSESLAANREAARKFLEQVLDVAEATVRAGKMNFGATLLLNPGSQVLVVGGFVADGKKLENAVRDVSAFAAKNPDFPRIKFDAAKHGDVAMHTSSVPLVGTPKEARDALGDPMEVVLGTGAQSVYLAFGKNSAAALKKVLEGSQERTAAELLPFELNVALRPIFRFASSLDRNPALKAAAEKLSDRKGDDRISLTVHPADRGFSMRLSVDEGVINAIGEGARLARSGAGR